MELTLAEWKEKYKPSKKLYEPFGADLKFVISQPSLTVWTECDDGDSNYIMNGYHWVNRLGYYISAVPFDPDDDIFIVLEIHDEEDEEDQVL